MEFFKNLNAEESEVLLKFPIYITLYAANGDSHLDEAEKKAAIELSHIKTFSCDSILAEFYKEADLNFKKNIESIDANLPKEKESRNAAIKLELSNLEKIVLKLGKDNSFVMHRSMESFKRHVSKAHHNVLLDFIFPLPIQGLTD
jgi:hypothetical protein